MSYFAYPLALWLLLLLPWLVTFALWNRARKRRALARLGNLFALQRSARIRPWRAWLRRSSLTLGLLLLAVGSAGPQWGRDTLSQTVGGRDIVVVLDLSRSMSAEPKSRRERAIAALVHLCDTVEKRGGHRLALIVFAAHAEIVCPLTHDYDHFRFVLGELGSGKLQPPIYPTSGTEISGTRIGAALALAVQLHGTRSPGAQDILLVSDGDDPGGDKEWRQGIQATRPFGLPVDVVGVGDPDTSWPIPTETGNLEHEDKVVRTRLEEGPLQEIAAQTGGNYLPLRNRPLPLGKLYHEVLANRERERDNTEGAYFVHAQRYAWFFAPALLLLSMPLLFGEGRSRYREQNE